MAKPTAPLLSFGARGQIGKTMVASNWKGRPYFRQYVIPGNPKSVEQTVTRSLFANLGSIWKVAGPLWRAPWTRFAQGQVLTDRNAFTGQNIKAMRGDTDMANMVFSPGAKGGLAAVSIIVTPGVGELDVAFVTPTPPTGWTLASAVAVAIADNDPQATTLFNSVEGEDAVTFNSVNLPGLTAATLYQVGAWLRWEKPDGSLAYGASLVDTGTPT